MEQTLSTIGRRFFHKEHTMVDSHNVIKEFLAQFQWISSSVDALLEGAPIPPREGQVGGQVGRLIHSLKELAERYKNLEKQEGEFKAKEHRFEAARSELEAQLSVEENATSNAAFLETNLRRSERRIEELKAINQELKSHILDLTKQLITRKEALASKNQLEERLSLREVELNGLLAKKGEIESHCKDLRQKIEDMSERLKEETRAFPSILKAGKLMDIALQPEEVLKRVCQIPLDVFGCQRSATFLWDQNSESFIPIHSLGIGASLMTPFRASKLRGSDMPLLTVLMARKKLLIIEESCKTPSKVKVYAGNRMVESFESPSPLLPKDYIEEFEIHSLFAIPFVSKGEVLGVMIADFGSVPHPFSQAEIVAMDGLGQLIGTALDNMRNYQETTQRLLDLERRAETTAVLKEIDEAIHSTNQVEQIIGTVIRVIPRVIGCEWVSVLLVDKQAKGFYVLGNLGNLVLGKGAIPFDYAGLDGVIPAVQVRYRANLEKESRPSVLDLYLLSHGICSDLLLPLSVAGEAIGMLHLSSRRVAGFIQEEIAIAQKISERLSDVLERAVAQRVEDRRKDDSYFGTIRTLIDSVAEKDFQFDDYRDQVMACGLEIARRLNLDEEQQQWIKYAIVLHDIGKSTIPSYILNKEDKLTEKEMVVLRSHPTKGAEMVKNFRFSELIKGMKLVKFVTPLIRHSYERWDGTGYPEGLAGEAIPVGARILSVVNAYAAMITDRPYRKALRSEEALREIQRGAGTQYDPRVVDVFLRHFSEI